MEGVRLLERETELAALESLIAAGTGAVAVIEGPAGIGKSSLLAAAVGEAADAGVRVLGARATELESDFPWLVVRELFEPALQAEDDLLTGAARLAAPVLGRGGPTPVRADETGGALHGLYWLAAGLAERGPLLVAVDDAHWAGRASLRWLAYLAARIADLPILLLVTTRPSAEPPELAGLLREATRTLRPAGLSEAAVGRLVREHLGEHAEPGFCTACLTATQGNPFLLHALTAELSEEGIEPTEANAERVGHIRPATVTRTILLRLARLQPDARRLATAAAVLGAAVALRDAAALAGLDEEQAGVLADRLAEADILAPELPLSFVHPIVRGAIHEALPAAERAAWHARAARLLTDRGSPPDAVAVHLLASEPSGDAAAATTLRLAAAAAAQRGAPETAVRCLQRALDECGEEAELLRELGEAGARVGDPAAAEHLTRALELGGGARCALALAPVLLRSGRARVAVDLLDRAADDEDDAELSLLLAAEAMACAREDFATTGSIPGRLARLREPAGTSRGELLVLANAAMQSAMTGDSAARTFELATRALAGGRLLATETSDSGACYLAVHALVAADRTGEALAYLDDALADARERGSPVGLAVASICRSHAHCCAGAIPNAIADARTALDLARTLGWEPMVPWALAFLLDALVEAGELDVARAELDATGLTGPLPEAPFFEPLAGARGWLALAQGDAEGALELSALGRRLAEAGSPNPGMSAWRSLAALALDRLERRDEARALAKEELALARAYGAPRAIAIALRTAARLAKPAERLALLAEAVAVLDGSPARLELARALVDLGAARRREGARTKAREDLRRGMDLASRCGAQALAARAREELVATGARPRRAAMSGPESLTASELRVVELAAKGHSNREIAEGLFVSLRTVEAHLTRSYQKLGIATRAEVAKALSPT